MIAAAQKQTENPDDVNWDLGRRIKNLLWQRSSLRHIVVDAEAGIVTLRGTVRSFYEKQLCISGSRRVPGVYELIDEIEVVWND